MATKSTATRTNSSRHLPIDVAWEILCLLPPKSLMRFRCVCKPWRDLITDPNFIEFHRNQNNHHHILIQYEIRHGSHVEEIFSLHCENTFVMHTRLELPQEFRVLGYSNGLVCLRSFDPNSEIYLWNPSIRKLKLLPDSTFHTAALECAKFAFAFVPQINDYRVLKICYDSSNVIVRIEIYSLRTNSWKMVEYKFHYQVKGNSSFERAVNGVVHFLAKDVDANNDIILSFNMIDEVFGKIILPEEVNNQYDEMYAMLVGELLLVIGVCYVRYMVTDIWDMDEDGDFEYWTQFNHRIQPLGFLKTGELVWKRYGNQNGEVLWSNKPSSKDSIISKVKDLQFIGVPSILHTFTHYMESLVLLDG